MTDLDNDPLASAFDEFRGQVAPLVRSPGVSRTRETVHSRKRNRTIALSTLVTLVIAIPITVELSTTAHVTHGPSAAASASAHRPSASAEPYFEPPRQTPSSLAAPQGGIRIGQLYNAKLDLPSWGSTAAVRTCPTTGTQLKNGTINAGKFTLWMDEVAYADLDHDGQYETIARILCGTDFGQPVSQVVAFHRDAGGAIRTIGQVMITTGPVKAVCGLRNDPNGAVEVQVADFPIPFGCSDANRTNERFIETQWRTFTWNGSTFVAGGPTVFPPNPYASDMTVTGSSDLVLVRQPNGHYRGTLTFTIRNLGSATMSYRADAVINTGWQVVGSSGCTPAPTVKAAGGGISDVYCAGTQFRGGSTRTMTLTVDAPRKASVNYDPSVELLYPENLGDPDDTNNHALYAIRFQG